MYQMSLLDDVQYREMSDLTWRIYREAESGNWTSATDDYNTLLDSMHAAAPGYSPYKITDFTKSRSESNLVYDMDIYDFMNGHVREKLEIIPKDKIWRMLSYQIWEAQRNSFDFGKHVWHLVDEILKTSDIDIVVYSGQLDIICSTSGALRWMNKLTWDGKKKFDAAERKMLTNPDTDVPEMFVKSYENVKMYWVLNAGHVVPADVPDVGLRMLNRILDDTD